VGLCVWRLAGATKNRTVFFGNADLKSLRIDRAANLIKVARQSGRFPMVTVLCARPSRNAREAPQ